MDSNAEVAMIQKKIAVKSDSISTKTRLNEADHKSIGARNLKLEVSMIQYNMHGSPSGETSVRAARIDTKFKKIRKNRNNMNQKNIKSIRIRNAVIKKQKRYVNRMFNQLTKITGQNHDDKKYQKHEYEGDDDGDSDAGDETSSDENEENKGMDDVVVKSNSDTEDDSE
jgi:hypothetical protein